MQQARSHDLREGSWEQPHQGACYECRLDSGVVPYAFGRTVAVSFDTLCCMI